MDLPEHLLIDVDRRHIAAAIRTIGLAETSRRLDKDQKTTLRLASGARTWPKTDRAVVMAITKLPELE